MKALPNVDLKTIHENYKELEKGYSQYGERFLYFLVSCSHLGPDLDIDITMELKPYGRLIAIDNFLSGQVFQFI